MSQPSGLGNSGPAEPMTPSAEAMAALHEWYTGLRSAGFTLVEACTIISCCITQSGMNGSGDDSQ